MIGSSGSIVEVVRAEAQRVYNGVTQPLANLLIRSGVTPNQITTVGAVVVVLSAVAFGTGWIRLGGGLLVLSGLIDTLDGQVARSSGQATRFGAFYDSTLDRVGDGATFIGIAVYLLTAPGIHLPVVGVVFCMLAILFSLLVSYARARAEGLGVECKVGVIQRAERILLLGVPTILVGPGPDGRLLLGIVALLALGSAVTVVQRFHHVYQVTVADRG